MKDINYAIVEVNTGPEVATKSLKITDVSNFPPKHDFIEDSTQD